MRVLVTGAAGFIGTHVRRELIARGHLVVGLDALVEQVHGDWLVKLRTGDPILFGRCQDALAIARAIEGCDAVIHLAAEVGVGQATYAIDRYVDANCRGTAVLLEAIIQRAATVRRLVVASSMSIYGEGAHYCDHCGVVSELMPAGVCPEYRFHACSTDYSFRWGTCTITGRARPCPTPETHPLKPASVYAITKRDQEELCLTVGAAYGIPTCALRFFNTYGEGQSLNNPYTGAVAIFAARLLRGEAPMVYEDGLQSRDFIHVTDVARAVVDAVESDVVGPFNVGTGVATTVLGLATMLHELIGGPAPVVTGQTRKGDIRHCIADVARIEHALGWTARVSLAEGLRRLVASLTPEMVATRRDTAHAELAERGLVG